MAHVVGAFGGREETECGGDQRDDLIEITGSRRAEERLQFGKRKFDGIEVGTVRRQEPELGARAFNRAAHVGVLVHDEVVEDDDVPARNVGTRIWSI